MQTPLVIGLLKLKMFHYRTHASNFQQSRLISLETSAAHRISKVFQPNIILVDVDDMRADELQYLRCIDPTGFPRYGLPKHVYAYNPLPGPSRATLMTGLFAERTGVFGNEAPLGGSANLDLSYSILR